MLQVAAVSCSVRVSASAAKPVACPTSSLAFPQRTALVWQLRLSPVHPPRRPAPQCPGCLGDLARAGPHLSDIPDHLHQIGVDGVKAGGQGLEVADSVLLPSGLLWKSWSWPNRALWQILW